MGKFAPNNKTENRYFNLIEISSVKIFEPNFYTLKEQKICRRLKRVQRNAVLYDIADLVTQERISKKDLQSFELPQIPVIEDVENLVEQLRQLCGCLLIRSSRFANPNDTIQILNVSEFQSWLEKCSVQYTTTRSSFSNP